MEKVVKLATKPKRAAPKAKHVDLIVHATFSGDAMLQGVIRALTLRLRDENTTVIFKSLIVLHTLLRSGSLDPTFSYLSSSSISLTLSPTDTPGLSSYASYLAARIKSYSNLKRDLIRDKSDRIATNRLRSLKVESGLLREVREVQRMMASLVEAKFYLDDIDDDVSMTALRLLVKDLLILFQSVNEGVINVLEHYFEMSHSDATTALKIYKTFCRDTEKVVAYLSVAKKLQNVLQVPIPNLKHAPVSLVGSLEEYLNDSNFAANREEYKENKRIADGGAPKKIVIKTSSATASPSKPAPASTSTATVFNNPTTTSTSFTDFFESIESAQTDMFNPSTNSPSSQYFQQQSTFNPFLLQQQQQQQQIESQQYQINQQRAMMTGYQPGLNPLFAQATGYAAFGGGGGGGAASNPFQQQYNPQQFSPPPPQQPISPFLSSQQTGFPVQQSQMTGGGGTGGMMSNPFRQTMLFTQPTGMGTPFGQNQNQPFSSPLSPPQLQQQQQPQQQLQQQQQQSSVFMTSPPRQSTYSSPPSTLSSPTRSNTAPSFFQPPQQQQQQQQQSPIISQPTGSRNPFGIRPPPAVASSPVVPSMGDLFKNYQVQQEQLRQSQSQSSQQSQQVSQQVNNNGMVQQSMMTGGAGQMMSSIASDFALNHQHPNNNNSNSNNVMRSNSPLAQSTLPPPPPTSSPFTPSAISNGTTTTTALPFQNSQPTGFSSSTSFTPRPFVPTSAFGMSEIANANSLGNNHNPFQMNSGGGGQVNGMSGHSNHSLI